MLALCSAARAGAYQYQAPPSHATVRSFTPEQSFEEGNEPEHSSLLPKVRQYCFGQIDMHSVYFLDRLMLVYYNPRTHTCLRALSTSRQCYAAQLLPVNDLALFPLQGLTSAALAPQDAAPRAGEYTGVQVVSTCSNPLCSTHADLYPS